MVKKVTRFFGRLYFYCQTVLILFFTISTSLQVIWAFVTRRNTSVFHRLVRLWAKRLMRVCNIRLDIMGSELIRPDASYIFVSNHSSLFDIPVLLASIDQDIRFMYKKELQKIPVFGWGMKRMPYIAINRSDPRDAMSSIDDAVQKINEGVSVVIFPEGTRSTTGIMGEFKRGAFMLAARTSKPIVPVTLVGTHRLIPKGNGYFSGSTVRVILNPPISNSGNISRQEERALMVDVRNTIAAELE